MILCILIHVQNHDFSSISLEISHLTLFKDAIALHVRKKAGYLTFGNNGIFIFVREVYDSSDF